MIPDVPKPVKDEVEEAEEILEEAKRLGQTVE